MSCCCPARHFDRPLSAVPVHGTPRGQNAASNNALAGAWLQELPLISKDTEAALAQWNAYLDWKQKLVQAGIAGARYLSRSLTSDGTWRFNVVVPDKTKEASFDRLLRGDDLCAYNFDYSGDSWEFQYREANRARSFSLADHKETKQVSTSRREWPEGLTEANLPNPYF